MQRLGIWLAVVLGALVALPAVAQASFHQQKVNEVMLASASGDSSVQFVEFFDPAPEPFPSFLGPYRLVIYDAAGHRLGGQDLDATKMAAASSNRPYLVSTPAADAAFPTATGDQTLTTSFPKSPGQACYTVGSGETAYSCITWGCITHFVDASAGAGSFHGAVPANGKSAQRQGNDSVQIASPTPKAANIAGTSPPACASSGIPFVGVQIPKQSVTVKKGKAPVSVKCPAKAKGNCVGKLTVKTAKAVKDSKGNKRVITLGSVQFTIAAGKTKTVKVPLTKNGKFVVAHHKSVKSTATAKSHDGTGKSKTTSGIVTVKRPAK